MSQSQVMTDADGTPARAYRRTARQIRAGDWLPDYSSHAVTDAVTDQEDGSHWTTLEDGRDIRFTRRGKVWLVRHYAAPEWMTSAVADWRAAYDSWRATRESGAPVDARIAGASGSLVCYAQLSDEEYRAICPAPRLASFIGDAAAARRAS